MTVQQLIAALRKLPAQAVVLLEDGAGYSAIGELAFEPSEMHGIPDEVILRPDMTDD